MENFISCAVKQLCWNLRIDKVTPEVVFSFEFCEIFKITCFVEHQFHLFIYIFNYTDVKWVNRAHILGDDLSRGGVVKGA